MTDGAYLYILRCVDGSYYTGTARAGLEQRVAEHNAGTYGGYTAQRRPVTLVFSQWFDRITDAIAAERRGEGWARAKKETPDSRGLCPPPPPAESGGAPPPPRPPPRRLHSHH